MESYDRLQINGLYEEVGIIISTTWSDVRGTLANLLGMYYWYHFKIILNKQQS